MRYLGNHGKSQFGKNPNFYQGLKSSANDHQHGIRSDGGRYLVAEHQIIILDVNFGKFKMLKIFKFKNKKIYRSESLQIFSGHTTHRPRHLAYYGVRSSGLCQNFQVLCYCIE